jgi:hypothetical protein
MKQQARDYKAGTHESLVPSKSEIDKQRKAQGIKGRIKDNPIAPAAKSQSPATTRAIEHAKAAGKGIAVKTQTGQWIVQSRENATRAIRLGVVKQIKRAVHSKAGQRVRGL